MTIFNWLRGRPERPAEPQTKDRQQATARCEFYGSLIRVPAADFTGLYSRSPNGRFILAWRDSNDEGSRGGARPSGHGRYLLIENDAVIAEGRVERPNDGKVADNGTFIINDWLFYREALEGVFLAFRKDGSPIIERRFEANLFNNGLSSDGRLAVCQTCNAANEDGSRLTIFDLEEGAEIGSCIPESGWARDYRFPSDGTVIRLGYGDLGDFAYGLDGAFIDREVWIAARLDAGDVYLVQRMLRDAGDAASPESLRLWMRGLSKAIIVNAKDPRALALAHKLLGSCHDRLGEVGEALAAYDSALALNPKIGVKKRADQLRGLLRG